MKKFPVTDTVNVYHFIISKNRKVIADTSRTNSMKRESATAYKWISEQAGKFDKRIIFKEYWPENKDTLLKSTFVYHTPTTNLSVLVRKRKFLMLTRKKTKTEPQKIENVDWKRAMKDSVEKQIGDSVLSLQLWSREIKESDSKPILMAYHFLKAQRSPILGFCWGNAIYIGSNTSCTIAHESLHFLGAPDLYIHRYWPGKRRRLVRKKLWSEIMDWAIEKKGDVKFYFVSDYTAYTMGWKSELNQKLKPLLKQKVIARLIFNIRLLLGLL